MLSILCLGCRKEDPAPSPVESVETGSVTIRLSTKSGDRGVAADSYDGHAFHDVLVIIADLNNNVVASQFVDEVDDGLGGHEHWEEKEVTFQRIQIGAYKVYAYANIDHTAAQVTGEYIEDIEGSLVRGQTLPVDRLVKTFTGTDVPGPARFDGQKRLGVSGILMTGFADLDVGVTSSSCTVELLRMVTRVNVYFNNHGDYPLYLKNLSFSNFNASTTYLLDHRDNGRPGIPQANVYRAMPSFDSTVEGAAIEIAPNGRDSLVYSTNVYENDAPVEYRIFGTAEMNGVTKTIHVKNCELLTYSQVNGMAKNAVKPVMMVCPKISNGKIMKADNSKAANFNGGNKEYVNNFVKSYSDDEAYIFYLKKTANSTYSIYKDAACTENIGIGGTSYTLSRGTRNLANSYGYANADLCRFAVGGNYLSLDGANNSIMGTNSSADAAECQWAIYHPLTEEGSRLKIIDNETAQVSLLDCMLRNQELNIIVNAYYNAAEGIFNFDVDNSYWSPGHTMTHIFK